MSTSTSVLASLYASASDVETSFPHRKVYSEDFGYTYMYMIALSDDHVICLYHYCDDFRGEDYLMIAFEGRISDEGTFYITHASAEDKKGSIQFSDALEVDSYPLECMETVFKVTCDFEDTTNISIEDWNQFHNNFMDIVHTTTEEKHKELYYITQHRDDDVRIP